MKNILADTNIFLEILLDQDKKENCKSFLNKNIGHLYISDFSLHSIGVHLVRNKQFEVYEKFVNDVLSEINLVTLEKRLYTKPITISKKFNLDFDDSYQCALAKEYGFSIATMDNDFKKVKDFVTVNFL